MEFEQKKRRNPNDEKYHIENLRIAREFSKELILEMKDLVKSIVLFGSNLNDTLNKDSDIDLMIVLDNVSVYVTPELREAYRIITSNLNTTVGKDKLHIMTVNFSDLWDMARKGDPVLINILRHGLPLFDRNIVEPMQYLLEVGKIKPTKESIYNYVARSTTLLDETKKHLEESLLDLYYCVIDITHATLMSQKITPPSPKEMPEIYSKTFKGKTIGKYSKDIKEFYTMAKDIEYKRSKNINGEYYDKMKEKASNLVMELKTFIDEEMKKESSFDL